MCFWWGGQRKIRWVSWKSMTKAKNMGGLGWRDFSAFNLALLAKQGWRIIHDPMSLLARSLKAKYFPRGSFFEAKLGARPSFVWRSFIVGRDTLVKGGVWRVGNGNDIRILEDHWLPDHNFPAGTESRLRLSNLSRVSHLINFQDGSWNDRLILETFDSCSARAILQVPVMKKESDLFAWRGTKNSQFTVRSAYYVAIQDSGQEPAGVSDPTFWPLVWKLDIDPKIKFFLWRLGNQSLPTLDNLSKKGMGAETICPVCRLAPENGAHVFMSCEWSLLLWNKLCPGLHPPSFANENLIDWYVRLHSILTYEDWLLFNVLLWFIWKNRNNAVFQVSCFNPNTVLILAKLLIRDFSSSSISKNFQAISVFWSKPPRGYVKINCDAAIFNGEQKIGIGVAVRDSEGRILRCKYLYESGNADIIQAEARALQAGVLLAKNAGYRYVWFESDSLMLIQALNCSCPSFLSCRQTIREIKEIVHLFDSCFFVFASREGNRLAHRLANLKENGQGRLPESLYYVALSDMNEV